MEKTHTVKTSAGIWMPNSALEYTTASQKIASLISGEEDASTVTFLKPSVDWSKGRNPWIKLGMAEIVMTLVSPESVVSEELRAMNAALQQMRADHQIAQQALMDRISNLQAITFDAGA